MLKGAYRRVQRWRTPLAVIAVVTLLVLVLWRALLPFPAMNRVEFVDINVDITLEGDPPDWGVPADFGPHCSPISYSGSLLVIDRAWYTRGTQVVVRIDYEMHHPGPFAWDGGDAQHPIFSEDGSGTVDIVSPVNASLVLFRIHVSGDTLRIENETVAPGHEWRGDFTYEVNEGAYTVVERFHLENVGFKVPFLHRPPPCM